MEMQESPRPYLRLIGISLLLNWLPPGLIFLLTRSVPALFITASIVSFFIGCLFLVFCLSLGRSMSEAQQQLKFQPLLWVMDLVVHHSFWPLRWPKTSRSWSFACIFLAGYFWVTAVLAFFWGTGNWRAEHSLTHW